MKKAILVVLVLGLLTGCANQHPEDWTPAKSKKSNGQKQSTNYTDLSGMAPLVQKEDGTFVPILAPVGFTEETILVKLTDTADKPQFSLQDSMKNATTNLTKMNAVGFGKLEKDMDKDGYYAISVPRPDANKWLHVTAGTEIDGEFKEGVLIDIFGNKLTVTELRFSFFYKKPPNANFNNNVTTLVVESQASYAKAQIVDTSQSMKVRVFPYSGFDNFQLRLRVEAVVVDATGYERTFSQFVYCGIKYSDLPIPSFNEMFAGY